MVPFETLKEQAVPTEYGIYEGIQKFGPLALHVVGRNEQYRFDKKYPTFIFDSNNNIIDASGRPTDIFSSLTNQIPWNRIQSNTGRFIYSGLAQLPSGAYSTLILRPLVPDWLNIIDTVGGNYLISGSNNRGGIFRDLNVRRYTTLLDKLAKNYLHR